MFIVFVVQVTKVLDLSVVTYFGSEKEILEGMSHVIASHTISTYK